MPRLSRPVLQITSVCLFITSSLLAIDTPYAQTAKKPAVLGELIKIEDQVLTVKDPTGKELQLTIDQGTTQVGMFHQGVYVQAWLLPDGRTESIVAYRTNKDTERELAARP